MKASPALRLPRRPSLVRVGVVAMVAMALFLPGWALYLAVILPREHVARDWDVTWVGFDIGLATLAALAVVTLRRHSEWTPVLAGALAAALVCDAWFDVTTSRDGDRFVALGLALLAELPIAAVAAVVGVRSVRMLRARSGRHV
jgi:hypothetical protein